jgi:hypothetical protein
VFTARSHANTNKNSQQTRKKRATKSDSQIIRNSITTRSQHIFEQKFTANANKISKEDMAHGREERRRCSM